MNNDTGSASAGIQPTDSTRGASYHLVEERCAALQRFAACCRMACCRGCTVFFVKRGNERLASSVRSSKNTHTPFINTHSTTHSGKAYISIYKSSLHYYDKSIGSSLPIGSHCIKALVIWTSFCREISISGATYRNKRKVLQH